MAQQTVSTILHEVVNARQWHLELKKTGGGPAPPKPNEYYHRILDVTGGLKRVIGHKQVPDPLEVRPLNY